MTDVVFRPQMIRDARLFSGRWHEIQQLTDALQRHMPVAVVGVAGSGKSSLLYHVAAAAPVLFDRTDMVSHYIDLAQFADIGQVRQALARAFGQSESQWLAYLPALAHAPLLAFDNADVAPCAAELDGWWQELAVAIQRGHVYCVQATSVPPLDPQWCTVALRAVTATQIQDLIDAALGEDAPRMSRTDQDWILLHSAGHMGRVVALLAMWHAHAGGADWQGAARAQLQPSADGASEDEPTAASPSRGYAVDEWQGGDDGASAPANVAADTPTRTGAQSSGITVQGLWWVALLAGLMALVWWLW